VIVLLYISLDITLTNDHNWEEKIVLPILQELSPFKFHQGREF